MSHIRVALLLLLVPLLLAGGAPGQEFAGPEAALDGAYKLVSSTYRGGSMAAPVWDGILVMKDGYLSRTYQRQIPPKEGEEDPPPPFHCNAGTWLLDGSMLYLRIRHSNEEDLCGVTFVNRVAWKGEGRLMIMTSSDPKSDFREVWERVRR